jgi:hypothetical protein
VLGEGVEVLVSEIRHASILPSSRDKVKAPSVAPAAHRRCPGMPAYFHTLNRVRHATEPSEEGLGMTIYR